MTKVSPSSYGISLETFSKLLEEDVGDDPTLLIAVYLGLAYQQVQKIGEEGVDLSSLITPSLERAWRENIHVRHTETPGTLNTEILTKYGAINASTTSGDSEPGTPGSGDAENQDQPPQRDNTGSYKTRYRRRRVVKPRGSKRDGSKGIHW